jgi:hypothetical protein
VKNSWIATPHLLFHSLFLEHGSPDGMPKVFNLAKGIFWFLILFLTIRSAQLFFQYLSPSRRKQSFNHTALIFGAAFSFWSSFYLWCTKAEVWFVALCHLMFWPWIGLILLDYARAQKPRALYSLGGACAVYGVFSILGSFVQMQRIQPEYNWTVYQDWVSCIDDEIQKNVPRPNPKIWQPHVPDILVELSSRHPNYDLTRALDFNARTDLAWAFTQKIDVLLITNFFDIPQGQSSPRYHGPSRPEDLVNQEKVPFGDWSLSRLPVEQPNQWETHVCHYGPFWASIILKTEESLSDRALPNQNSHQ